MSYNFFSALKVTKRVGTLIVFSALMFNSAVAAPQPTPVGTVIVVGDSLSAGFQSFSLLRSSQQNGFAALVAKQATGLDLALPLITAPGIPPVLLLQPTPANPFNIVRSDPDPNVGRVDPTLQAFNLSVPGFTVANALSYTVVNPIPPITNPIDGMALAVLATPGTPSNPPCGAIGQTPTGGIVLSEVACAVRLATVSPHPQTILVSIGGNDALQTLTFGAPPTAIADFTASYAMLLGALKSTGANVVVANVPDVTAVPFLRTAQEFSTTCHYLPSGATLSDYVVPDITNPTTSHFDLCNNYVARSATMIDQAQAAVRSYNTTIATLARLAGVTVVDFNGLLADLAANGTTIARDHLTTRFLGGLFSLDGIHPTNTGYALLANEFIKTMNTRLNTDIPPVNVKQVEIADPLVFNKLNH